MAARGIVSLGSVRDMLTHIRMIFVTFTWQIYRTVVILCLHHGVLLVTHYCQICGEQCCFNINKSYLMEGYCC